MPLSPLLAPRAPPPSLPPFDLSLYSVIRVRVRVRVRARLENDGRAIGASVSFWDRARVRLSSSSRSLGPCGLGRLRVCYLAGCTVN